MKKILFITAFPPSEIAAAEKNTKLMLRDLAKNYEVDLIYFKDDNVDKYSPESSSVSVKKVIRNSREYRIKNVLSHPLFHPIFTVRYNGAVKRFLQNLIDNTHYSAIIFDHSQTLMYARKLRYSGPKVLLSHDVEAQRFARSSGKLATWFCRHSEKYVLTTEGSHVFTFCEKDIDIIRDYYDVEALLCLDYIDDKIINVNAKTQNDSFVMFGNWRRSDNSEGAVWLLNGLADYLLNPITVNIIGNHFPAEKLVLNDKIKVNVLGFVDNPYPMISESKAMLCPLFSGAGIKVKVIESLACGTPVIGTDIAFEGFSEKYRSFMIQTQQLQEFATQMEQIDCPMEKRIMFKKMFIDDYQSMTIPNWLEKSI